MKKLMMKTVLGAWCLVLGAGVAMADLAVTNEVVVLATGGTIAGVHEDRSAVTGYKAGGAARTIFCGRCPRSRASRRSGLGRCSRWRART